MLDSTVAGTILEFLKIGDLAAAQEICDEHQCSFEDAQKWDFAFHQPIEERQYYGF